MRRFFDRTGLQCTTAALASAVAWWLHPDLAHWAIIFGALSLICAFGLALSPKAKP